MIQKTKLNTVLIENILEWAKIDQELRFASKENNGY